MARRRSYGRKSRSYGGGRRRSGGGRKRGSGGRYVSAGGGAVSSGGSRSGSISPMMIVGIAGAALVGFYLLKSKGTHPAVHAAAMSQQPGGINPASGVNSTTGMTDAQVQAAFSAAGGNTDFNSMTNIGLPIPYNPAPGTNSGPLQL